MFSDSEDDLCIFVCGTCKRYFTQLSAFAQHKAERLCRRRSSVEILSQSNAFENHVAENNAEEIDTDENADVLDGEDTGDCSNEQFMRIKDNYLNSLKRKYPRKQDKTKIKRTVRDLDPEGHLLFGEQPELDAKRAESATDAGGLNSMVAFSDYAQADRLFGKTSEKADCSCRHPVYVCKVCNTEFANLHLQGKPYKCLHCRRGFFTEGELRQHMVRAKHDKLCDVCGKIFPDKYKLRKHELSHVTEKNFKCDVPGCTKAFKSANDVKTHVKYVHAADKRGFKCTQCPRAFSRPDKCKLHVLMKHAGAALSGIPSSEERLPGSVESLLDKSNSAVESENNSSPFGSNFHGPSEGDVSHSFGQETKSASINATPCLDILVKGDISSGNCFNHPSEGDVSHSFGQETKSTSINATPYLDISVKGDISSDNCLNRSNENLSDTTEGGNCTKSHTSKQLTQSTTVLFPSINLTDDVKSEDSNAGTLNDHSNAGNSPTMNSEAIDRITHEGGPGLACPNYLCDECGRRFTRIEDLASHAQEHSAEMESGQECERCRMHFLDDGEFAAHEERRADHVLRCKYCSGKFLSVCELCSHERESHDSSVGLPGFLGHNEMPAQDVVARQQPKHVCQECGKVFTRADKLRRHAIIHSPDRPCIPCKYRESHDCMITFYRKDAMNRHALTHTLSKPYKCDICDKSFSRQDYVTKHISHVHKRIFKHRCMLCDYGTREPKRLRIHIRSRHEIDPDSLLPPSSPSYDPGFEDYPGEESQPQALPSSITFDAKQKVGFQDFDITEPSRLADTAKVSVDDGAVSDYVDEENVHNLSPLSAISEGVDQRYSVSAVIGGVDDTEPMEDDTGQMLFSTPGDVSISEGGQNSDTGVQINVWKTERKTPLNSL